jgi:hypothetical protein
MGLPYLLTLAVGVAVWLVLMWGLRTITEAQHDLRGPWACERRKCRSHGSRAYRNAAEVYDSDPCLSNLHALGASLGYTCADLVGLSIDQILDRLGVYLWPQDVLPTGQRLDDYRSEWCA